MSKNLQVNNQLVIPSSEIKLSFSRSSGAGGQNVNKVNSKVMLRWSVILSAAISSEVKKQFVKRNSSFITKEGDYLISSSESRDQSRNIEICYEKFKLALLAALIKDKKRIKTKPGKGSKEKRIKTKKKHAYKKSLRSKASYE